MAIIVIITCTTNEYVDMYTSFARAQNIEEEEEEEEELSERGRAERAKPLRARS